MNPHVPPSNYDASADYTARMKLHAPRPHNGGAYVSTVIGDASVVTTFDTGLVALSISDHEAEHLPTKLRGVLMCLSADDAIALGHELQLAGGIAKKADTDGV